MSLFSEGLAEEASIYRGSAASLYRECSEYVHGNAQTHQIIGESLSFQDSVLTAWIAKSSAVRLTITFSLAARYLEDLDKDSVSLLESTLLDHLGFSTAIRAIIGATTESTHV